MDARYVQVYRELYERHWWWRARERLILAALPGLLSRPGGETILDVGCGDGLFFDRLSAFGEVEGIEPDADAVTPGGRWAPRIRIQPFDAAFEPGRRYSLITMLDVLEHLPDAAAALKHAARLLEPSGTLLVTVPAFQALWTGHDEINHHVRRFTRGELVPLVEAAGLAVVAARYCFYWTFPAKLLVRAKERVVGGEPRPAQVPPAALNRVLYGVSVLEEKILGRLPVPFGSSLLVAAHRPVASAESARVIR